MTGTNDNLEALSSAETAAEGAALQLLEILESLTVVYQSANYFAEVGNDHSIAEYTLSLCLDAIQCETGAIYFSTPDGLEVQAEKRGASALLRTTAVDIRSKGALFRNGAAASEFVVERAAGRSVLCAPIRANDNTLGIVVAVGATNQQFTTQEAKLVTAVTSQAAIALSSALHYRTVALERSKLRSVIEANRDGIIVLLPSGQTVLCNSVARSMFGLSEEEAEGLDFPTMLADWKTKDTVDVLNLGTDEVDFRRRSGERVISLRSSVVRGVDGGVANIILTIHEVTEKRREERLKRDFLSLMSHKFRTPLTAFIASIDFLEEGIEEERPELLAEASMRAQELANLVDKLLYFAEIMEGSWSVAGECNLVELSSELDAQLKKRYGDREASLEWSFAEDAVTVGIDKSRLRVVLENLIENAIKFAESEGIWVQISSERVGDDVVVHVQDRAPTIPSVQVGRIFESFHECEEDFTGKVPGAGIGLSIVNEIIQQLGGRIEIEPAEPSGNVFSVSIPVRQRMGRRT